MIFLALLFTPSAAVFPVHGNGTTGSYLVQAADLETARQAVVRVGGEVTHELGIIHAVGAELTPQQAARLERSPDLNILADSPVTVAVNNETVRDDFANVSWSNNDGTAN